ncbi:MAG: NAD(P)/FAD-dependent oxidoreductase, partial [Verrucomicrobiota bacterium]|nr:NAD(P)/FAD-dependent oxidoreductase [Verrucomicrobiota bacterium]
MNPENTWDAVIIGGGIAGLSAAIYLGRARHKTLVVSSGRSMATWEPDVQNYLGFPEGVSGEDLIKGGRRQARRYGVEFVEDEAQHAKIIDGVFHVQGKADSYAGRKVLLATGIYHIPPDIPGVEECLGHSMFFCKDCDGHRVQRGRIAVFGHNDEAVEYALGLLTYSPSVMIVTHAKAETWDEIHGAWLAEYEIPVCRGKIVEVEHEGCQLRSVRLAGGERVALDYLFTTRGDIYYNEIARDLGAQTDESGEIVTDVCLMTTVPGLYAAGCVTAANCQMIIAAGQGAIAAQAINRKLLEESLATHSLRRMR